MGRAISHVRHALADKPPAWSATARSAPSYAEAGMSLKHKPRVKSMAELNDWLEDQSPNISKSNGLPRMSLLGFPACDKLAASICFPSDSCRK